MKKLLLIIIFISNTLYAQNILRVNNTPGVNVPYTTIAAAVAAAGANDIIMVEGSLTNYGDVTIAKKVTIVAPGYFLNENTDLQASLYSAFFNNVTFNSGASGSSISGIIFAAGITLNSVSNIVIRGCQTTSGTILLNGTGSNISILGNYIGNFFMNTSSSYTGVVAANNFIGGLIDTGNISSFTFYNNIVNGGATINTSDFRNNIIIRNSQLSFSGTIVKNNVFVFAQTGVDATNKTSVASSSLFVGATGYTTDSQWMLKSGSPAIGAGESGIDCGMYGGTVPYKLSGIQGGQPTITLISNQASVPQNGVMNVKVSAKVN